MKLKKAFTLLEITIVILIVSIILSILYQIFMGTFSQMFKVSTKMTNLRAASIILEKFKSDARCAMVNQPYEATPNSIDSKKSDYVEDIEKTESLTFWTTNEGKEEGKEVKYTYDGKELKRHFDDRTREISKAMVTNFKVVASGTEHHKFITVEITVDNEGERQNRSNNSKGNEVKLKAFLYPRFFEESLNEEEKNWYNGRLSNTDVGNDNDEP